MSLKRIELIEKKLLEQTEAYIVVSGSISSGITTREISQQLDLDRGNVSKELNILVRDGKAIKIIGRPVEYLHKKYLEERFSRRIPEHEFTSTSQLMEQLTTRTIERNSTDVFADLIGYDGSLVGAINKSKAAILYPENGLATLITGETGVGKTLFAEKMYEYAVEEKVIEQTANLVYFNCADYADNQQLLLSHLFGYQKGTFTGATENKNGLVEEANGGILFLDEVHRLSPKGQEMLFTLMDKGLYQRLGEVNYSRKASVRLIAATTEEPSKTMLSTFIRRIPINITLPSLKNRSLREKLKLMEYFFLEESYRVNEQILVSNTVIKALLAYEFTGNVGHLKSEIQFICANAFLGFVSSRSKQVKVNRTELASHILDNYLSLSGQSKKEISEFVYQNDVISEYPPTNLEINREFAESANQYQQIEALWESHLMDGHQESKIKLLIRESIENYTGKLIKKVETLSQENETVYSSLINSQIYERVLTSLDNDSIALNEAKQIAKVVTYHIEQLIEQGKNACIEQQDTQFLLSDQPQGEIVSNIFASISTHLDLKFSNQDKRILASIVEHLLNPQKKIIPVLIIMHGNSTASSMAQTVNELLDVKHTYSIDMRLTDEVDYVLKQTIELVNRIDNGEGVLILADMGSIISFPSKIYDEIGIETKVIGMVTTLLAIEATKLSLSGTDNLQELHDNLKANFDHSLQLNGPSVDSSISYFDSVLINNMKKILNFLDSEKVFLLLKSVLKEIEKNINDKHQDDFLIRFVFHSSCMIERVFKKQVLHYKEVEVCLENHPTLFQILRKSFELVEQKYDIVIPNQELCHLVEMFLNEYPTLYKHSELISQELK